MARHPKRITAEDSIGTVGAPIPQTEIKIVDCKDGTTLLPNGSTGEICVRGPQVMQGYYDDPEATTKVLSPDGWLRTGDIGLFDENGLLKIVGKADELIKGNGYQVKECFDLLIY